MVARLNALIWEGEGEGGEVCSKRNLSRVLFFATCLMATLKFNSRGLLENHKFLHSFFSPSFSVPFLFIPPLPLFTCSRPDGENKNCPANLATQPKFFFPLFELETALETRWFIKRRAPAPVKNQFFRTPWTGLFSHVGVSSHVASWLKITVFRDEGI